VGHFTLRDLGGAEWGGGGGVRVERRGGVDRRPSRVGRTKAAFKTL